MDTASVGWQEVFAERGLRIARRHQLLAAGATGNGLTAAVRGGYLIRVMRDHYALPGTNRHLLQAVRVGGRMACISALRERSASRSRSPNNRFTPLTAHNRDGAELHWWPLARPGDGTEYRVGVADALAQSLRCQEPWHAVASIDNAIHLGLVTGDDVTRIFAQVPERLRHLQTFLDGRSESGLESVLRWIVREAGLDFEIQVQIPGVGRVDMVVAGRLVVEADSQSAHNSWEKHVSDRNRDLALARVGYMSLRPVYERIMFTPEDVLAGILGLLSENRPFRTV